VYIHNRQHLVDHGARELRDVAVEILEHALAAADPYNAVKELVHLEGERLSVGNLHYNLSQVGRVYVLGGGKATFRVAQALDEILGARISGGVVATNRPPPQQLQHIQVLVASHPIPDHSSYGSACEVMACAQAAQAGDLVFAAITGGSSALLCYPAEGVSLEEKRQVHQLLLNSGADILAINAVRKHLSRIKGGLLTQAILPAEVINLTVSDVVGDPFDYITGPTVADTSCVADAVEVLKAYGLWERVAPSVRSHLSQGQDAETPKAFDPDLVHTFLLVPSAAACNAASSKAQALGFEPLVLTTSLEGESQEAGIVLGSIAREILRTGRPLPPPCAVVASGEVTVTVLDAQGAGGPSQELALGAAMAIEGLPGAVVASIDTDGFDGPTEFAGALADGSTVARARQLQHDLFRELRVHNVTPLLKDLKDGLLTGPTGTNIADLVVMLVAEDRG
jgi:glycerate-2-kinase